MNTKCSLGYVLIANVFFYLALILPTIMVIEMEGGVSEIHKWVVSMAIAIVCGLTVNDLLLPNEYSFKLVRMYDA